MLVISRKVGQVFTVGENVVVYFLGYGNGRASIGVEAPREVPILRDDIKVAMAAGVPLHAIEDALDSRENQEPTPEATEECNPRSDRGTRSARNHGARARVDH